MRRQVVRERRLRRIRRSDARLACLPGFSYASGGNHDEVFGLRAHPCQRCEVLQPGSRYIAKHASHCRRRPDQANYRPARGADAARD